jgi:hypothetical protein
MPNGIVRTTFAATVLVTSFASPALAQREPTLTDIAGCNEQAAARTGPSALPHPGTRSPESTNRNAPRGDTRAPVREKTDPSGSVITRTPDPFVKGMDATKADDPQYREAYRDCMRTKLSGR